MYFYWHVVAVRIVRHNKYIKGRKSGRLIKPRLAWCSSSNSLHRCPFNSSTENESQFDVNTAIQLIRCLLNRDSSTFRFGKMTRNCQEGSGPVRNEKYHHYLTRESSLDVVCSRRFFFSHSPPPIANRSLYRRRTKNERAPERARAWTRDESKKPNKQTNGRRTSRTEQAYNAVWRGRMRTVRVRTTDN